MKKICIATGLYPPDIGGPATYTRMLEEELPQFGIEPVVVPFGSVRHLPKVVRHAAYMRALMKQAKDADAIYALDPVSTGLPAYLVSKILRKPFLIRVAGDYAWEQGRIRFGLTCTLDEYVVGAERRPLPVRFLAFVERFVVRRARLVIVPSQYLRRIVSSWPVPPERIEVVYSALFPLPAPSDRASVRKQLAYEDTVLITAARLTPWKGVDSVIAATKLLNDDGLKTTLIVAGDGEAKASLEAKAAELGISERVRFVGKLSAEALGAAIKAADVFVYNTQYEGLPHQLLEVMDLSVPIVTTNIPGNREVITDGMDGILVPPNNVPELAAATKRVLENTQLRNRLVQNGRVRVKHFDRHVVVGELATHLHDVD